MEALSKFSDLVQTFKNAAIEDAVLSVHKFNEARLDYLGAQAKVPPIVSLC